MASNEELFSSLYVDLKRLARLELRRQNSPAAPGVTTLVHEVYLDLVNRNDLQFPDRFRFLAYATRAMRGLVIDHARRRFAQKRGGEFKLTTLNTAVVDLISNEDDLQQLSDALDALTETDSTLAEVVDLKFFGGFSFAEIGAMRGTSERTVQRQWEKARLYLHRSIAA
jgi:RNA polymerase sigma factor (TIGR02999 family)